MIIYSKILPPKGYKAITLWPFIVVRDGQRMFEWDIIHEKIHLRQQIELLILPFYLVYLVNYLVLLVKYRNKHKAYRGICFEKEAYSNERGRDYLKNRKFWNWTKYL